MTWLYLALSLIVFLGLPVGVYISSLAAEELKPGRKFFLTARWILLLVIGVAFILYNQSWLFVLLLLVLVGAFSLLQRKIELYLIILAFVLFLSSSYNGLGQLAVLAFLFFMLDAAAELSVRKKVTLKNIWDVLGLRIVFPVTVLLLFVAGLLLPVFF